MDALDDPGRRRIRSFLLPARHIRHPAPCPYVMTVFAATTLPECTCRR
jgi:hypothetical protein